MEGLALIAAALLGGGGIGSFVLSIRRPRGEGDRENTLIDQYQEQVASLRDEVAQVKKENEKLRSREVLVISHLWTLHQHIMEGKPPPPPPFPAGLFGDGVTP